jgi:hypothetical protein
LQYNPSSSPSIPTGHAKAHPALLRRRTLAACSSEAVARDVEVWRVPAIERDTPMLQREWAGTDGP